MEETTRKAIRFSLGRLLMTPGVRDHVAGEALLTSLNRHARGDWGDLDDEDKATNDWAAAHGGRLLSAYHTAPGILSGGSVKFWIITEADRSATTALLPDEY